VINCARFFSFYTFTTFLRVENLPFVFFVCCQQTSVQIIMSSWKNQVQRALLHISIAKPYWSILFTCYICKFFVYFYFCRQGSLVKLVTMGGLYIFGAFLYAARIPERWLPGKCDIWFQSHQLFHVLVVAAAFVHYHGISEMAMRRLKHLGPQCPTLSVTLDSTNIV